MCITYSGVLIRIDDTVTKIPLNEDNVATLKKKNSDKDLISRACQIGAMVLM